MTNFINTLKDFFRSNKPSTAQGAEIEESDFITNRNIEEIDAIIDQLNNGQLAPAKPEYEPEAAVSQHAQEAHTVKSSKLSMILNKDHFSSGYSDGSQYHKRDILRLRKNSLKDEIKMAAEQQLNSIKSKVFKIKLNLADLKGMSDMEGAHDALEVQLEEQIDQQETLRAYLNDLIHDTGPLYKAIQDYETGFACGYEDHLKSDLLFKDNNLI